MHKKMLKFFFKKREIIKLKFNRVLPFCEYISDRWEKARYLGFGKGSSIYDSAVVIGDVTVGENTWIGPNVILDGSGCLEVGSNCSISAGVQIYSHDSLSWAISGGVKNYKYAKTVIEDNCYIGPNVIIQKGIKIGRGSIIGANSLVNKDIPANSKAFGTPIEIKGGVIEDR
ncbi:acyltransferase [Francisella sp. LA112445]|uniref:acyltransferase n=1 Tax=Francisella sp. LA112445 TaxID=1395624 RepID=UPI001788B839|nr:acyltransferase [Francisella sp. LA112445]QIW09659.1 acyltransferase [Francisella sp. LA112445]